MNSLILSLMALSCFALLFIFVPIIRFGREKQQEQVTAGWFEQRAEELEEEYKQGQFSQLQYETALQELKLTAKNELTSSFRQSHAEHHEFSSRARLLTATIFIIAVVSFYALNGNLKQLSDWQEAIDAMPQLTEKIIQNSDAQPTPEELRQFALGLRTKLAVHEEPIGWMLLGRTLLGLNDINSSITAFQKAYEGEPTNLSNIVNYAQALYLKGEEFELVKATNLLRDALKQEPNNTMALILFGESNLMLENYQLALNSFELVLTQVPLQDPRRQALLQRIDFTKQALGITVKGLKLKVEVASDIDLSQFKYLFVFAQTDSNPMPVAVKKLDITAFPLDIVLNDADIMLPDVKLSQQQQVNITARLSKDDAAARSEGEWQTVIKQIDPNNSAPLTMVINKD